MSHLLTPPSSPRLKAAIAVLPLAPLKKKNYRGEQTCSYTRSDEFVVKPTKQSPPQVSTNAPAKRMKHDDSYISYSYE